MIKLILLLFLCSCSHVAIVNTSKHLVTFTARPGHSEIVEKIYEKQFYLWGLYPKKQTIDIGEVLERKDFSSASSLEVKKQMTLGTFLWPVVSLGFVVPKTFKVKFRAKY